MAAQTFRFKTSGTRGEQALAPGGFEHGSSTDRNQISPYEPSPALFHKVEHDRSILALAVIGSSLFAGTQGGEIVVWSLDTFTQLHCIKAHRGAVLGLFISQDGKLLFSCGCDAIVNVWCTEELSRLYSIYSTYDVGDVFCVVYCSQKSTLYLGAQNTSIQWYDLSRKDCSPVFDLSSHPSQRTHRFFDSKGPGGVSTPRPSDEEETHDHGGRILEIGKCNIVQYAHYGYVYCMLLAESSPRGGDMLISGGGDGSIKLWQLDDQNGSISQMATLESSENSVLSLALNGMLLYAGQLEGEVHVWDLDTRQLIQVVKAHDTDVLTLSVGYGFVLTGGYEGQAKIFERYRCKTRWDAHQGLILASALIQHNGNPYYLTGGNDNAVSIWDLAEYFSNSPKQNQASNEQLLESLTRFVSFATVSSLQEYTDDCHQGASWLRNLLKRFGATTEMLATEKGLNPVVFARFKGKKNTGKRLLFYGHYDVMPAENKNSKWNGNPFRLQGRDGYLYGRGISDNKGPIMAAIYAVADLIAEQTLETDVVFLIEGEEECGSRGFEDTIQKNKTLIGKVDWILVANSYWLGDDFPCLTYGLRGVIQATICIKGGEKDLHSGVNGTNLMHEPLKDLVALVGGLTLPDGRINVPGFYDDILPITKAEENWYDDISKRSLEYGSKYQDAESLKAKWREPSLTIHHFRTSGSGNSTIIPHVASAVISFRLVPEQSAKGILKSLSGYLHERFEALKTSNKMSITTRHPVEPWLGNPNNEIFKTLEEAIIDVWGLRRDGESRSNLPADGYFGQTLGQNQQPKSKSGQAGRSKTKDKPHGKEKEPPINRQGQDAEMSQRPLYIREGGSIPAIRFLEKEFGAPAAQLPCGQARDNAHLDNERLRLLNLYNSRKIFQRLFSELPKKG